MFTGIIEEVGTIKAIQRGAKSSVLTIGGSVVFEDVKIGDSVAVNGVCLTVTELGDRIFKADVMHETLNRSSLGSVKQGSAVNLERAMSANGRFGGHIVSGHIDGTGVISKIKRDGNAVWYFIKAEPQLLKYIVEKGSIAIDGISLTVAGVTDIDFCVSVIPHTSAETTLSSKRVGDIVNLENDVLAKYIEKLCCSDNRQSGITKEFLMKFGF